MRPALRPSPRRGTSAIEWELSCQDSYSGDALKVLTDFLNSCTY